MGTIRRCVERQDASGQGIPVTQEDVVEIDRTWDVLLLTRRSGLLLDLKNCGVLAPHPRRLSETRRCSES